MNFLRKISLRTKFIAILVTVTTSMLLIYALLALTDFQSDKLAYVFESNTSTSRSAANQIRAELDFVIEKLQVYLRGYSLQNNAFHSTAMSSFRNESLLESVWTYHFDSNLGSHRFFSQIGKESLGVLSSPAWKEYFQLVVDDTLTNQVTIRIFDPNPTQWIVGLSVQPDKSSRPFVIMGLVKKSSFVEAFADSSLSDSFLINNQGEIIVHPMNPSYASDLSLVQDAIRSTLEKIDAPIGTHKFSAADGDWLISLASVGFGNMKVISLIPEATALEAIRVLLIKSAILFLFLAFTTVFISVLASNRLTGALQKLFEATKQIGQGDFDIRVQVNTQDEIGGLAEGFNHMAVEIKRLLEETAEKTRMEAELKTAQVVQSTLFPESEFENSSITLKGHYEPASECGGDWWYFSQIGKKTYLWIGDATGHGVPAALVTSAAKSASSVVEKFPDLKLSKIMELMNGAIYGTARGQVLMTFFLACLDNETGTLEYVSASHDPPFFLSHPEDGSEIKKRDVIPLMDKTGPRLGEKPESSYETCMVQLKTGDRIVFYTDGIPELKGADGTLWGERKFINALLKPYNEKMDVFESMDQLFESLVQHRNGQPLDDDITYFMVDIKKVA